MVGGFSPADSVVYHPSEPMRERVAVLIRRSKNEGLKEAEHDKLAHCMQLKHLLRLVKAKARQRLAA